MRERTPGADVTPAHLARRDWWSGPEAYILVDDYDLLTGPAGGSLNALIALLPQAADVGLHVVPRRSATQLQGGRLPASAGDQR